MKNLPLCKTMCQTCPFRPGSPYFALSSSLTKSALFEASRICHSTGSNNAINKQTGRPPAYCRGARDVQLKYMAAVGVIAAPTDEAWNAKRVECGMKPTPVVDYFPAT